MSAIPKVLIVDDDTRMCDSLMALLNNQDYALEACNSGKHAIENLNRHDVDLVLLDMIIPDLDGHQVMDYINQQGLDTMVIVITGNATTDSAIGSLRRGAYDYIRKPFEPEELLTTVKNGLDQKRLKRENKVIHTQLALSEKRYRFLVQNSPDIIYTLDDMGNFTFVSNAVEKLLNYTIEQLIGKHYSIIVHESDLKKAEWAFNERRTGDRATSGIELRLNISNGSGELKHVKSKHLAIELKSNGMYDKSVENNKKEFLGTHGVVRDVNERKQLEEQLHQAQRIEALGTLAGGISHDFNNLLMGIQGRASLMLMDTEPSHPHYEHLKGIEDYLKSASDLTKQLLGFARGGKYEILPTNLNDMINKTSNMFGRTKKEITIQTEHDDTPCVSEIDQRQIEMVFLNLYVNAWQAMPGGGSLYIRTENIKIDEYDKESFQVEPGSYVKISVTDTGTGMDEATKKRIFDPFFTTKEHGRGTGLGLASAYGIIKNHGGFIDVYSQIGKGTTFNVYLPASEKEAHKEKELHEEVLTGVESILLVDDEDIIIDVGSGVLKKIGYHVRTAKSGKEAIIIYEENHDTIDLVILDMIMPGMNGGETYDRLKEINPNIKALLSSGYSVNGQATEIIKRGCDGFIQKPFNLNELSKKMRKILDEE